MKKIILSMCVLGLNVSVFGMEVTSVVTSQLILPNQDLYITLKTDAEKELPEARQNLSSLEEGLSQAQQILKSEPKLTFTVDKNNEVNKLERDIAKSKRRISEAELIINKALLPVTNMRPNDPNVTIGHIKSSYACVIVKLVTDRYCRIPGVNGYRGNVFQQVKDQIMGSADKLTLSFI